MDRPSNSILSKYSIGKPNFLLNWDISSIRNYFPILNKKFINGSSLIWMDNGATTHKPYSTIKKINDYYSKYNSNVHRSAHKLAEESTDIYEGARDQIKDFINARSPNEIIFKRGTTEGINFIVNSLGKKILMPTDTVLVSEMEHHANIVPWQLLKKEIGFHLDYIRIKKDGTLDIADLEAKLNPSVKILSITHVSNVLGTINPIEEIIKKAKKFNIFTIIDGAQSIAHIQINIQKLNPDFFVFSAHKLYGPSGIGVVYGKKEILEQLPPWQGGGHMVKDVTMQHTTFQDPPHKFEAGTGSLASVAGLGETIKFLRSLNWKNLYGYEIALNDYGLNQLKTIPKIDILGNAKERLPIFSFNIKNINLKELSKHLDKNGISVRLGHHCALPTVRRFGYEKTIRASLSLYNTFGEIDILVRKIKEFINLQKYKK